MAEPLVITYSKQVQFDSFWLRKHHESTGAGTPKNVSDRSVNKTVRILSHGKVVSQTQVNLSEKDWVLIMPKNFDPDTKAKYHMGFVAGDTLEIEGGVDLDSIVVSWSGMAFTDFLAGWNQGRSAHNDNYDNFSAFVFRNDEKEKMRHYICEECLIPVEDSLLNQSKRKIKKGAVYIQIR